MTFSDIDKSLEEKESLNSVTTSTVTSTTEYYSAISSDDEFFDLPSDPEGDGLETPTNENINLKNSANGGNATNGLVQKALERLEAEYVVDPERKELVKFFRTIGKHFTFGPKSINILVSKLGMLRFRV